jgi:hypothetical protein
VTSEARSRLFLPDTGQEFGIFAGRGASSSMPPGPSGHTTSGRQRARLPKGGEVVRKSKHDKREIDRSWWGPVNLALALLRLVVEVIDWLDDELGWWW